MKSNLWKAKKGMTPFSWNRGVVGSQYWKRVVAMSHARPAQARATFVDG
ncbi:MAG TPA: hypothetical protein VGC19_09635 [Rhodanobacter sp.]